MKIVEFMYPEYTNIYGESYNLEYLKRCNKDIKVIETHVGDTPKFITGEADRNFIINAIQSGIIFVVTGNALEIFGTKIIGDEVMSDNKIDIRGLSIFDYQSVRHMKQMRHNSQYIGNFEGMLMLGHRSQYSYCYGEFNNYFIKIYRGKGMNPDTDREGVHVKNFFGTFHQIHPETSWSQGRSCI